MKLVSEHLVSSGVLYQNGQLTAAKRTGESVIATKIGFISEASFVLEATVNNDRQEQPWQNIRFLLGSDGWQDYSSFSMFGKEAFLFNEISLDKFDVNKTSENLYVPVKYGRDYKLSLFYDGKKKAISTWVDDSLIYENIPVTVASHVINLGFKFVQTTGSIKDIHIYKTDSGLKGVPDYVNTPFKGLSMKSPETGDVIVIIIELLIGAAFVFGTIIAIKIHCVRGEK